MIVTVEELGIATGAVYTPPEEMEPNAPEPPLIPFTAQVTFCPTEELPCTVAVHWLPRPSTTVVGTHEVETPVTTALTVTVVEPDLVESAIDVAVIVAVPAAAGVKTPELLTLPIPVGATDQVTPPLPDPVVVAEQADV